MISRTWTRLVLVAGLGMAAGACGDDGPGLEDYYPELPPVGGVQTVFAGEVTAANAGELVTGTAAQGMIGDFYMRNDKVRLIIGAPTRVIGVVPQGGNLIDAVMTDETGNQLHGDHFGELSMVYKAGRTCEHTRMEIVRDGSEGGAAVLRAIGVSGNNDFINLKGLGALPVGDDLDPDVPDQLECATTYVLEPGATRVAVYWSIFNAGTLRMIAPLGMLNDTGGETEAWSNGRGFERAGIEALASLTDPAPIDYVVYQGPDVAYGVVPQFAVPTTSFGVLIAGVSIVLFGAENLLDIFDQTTYQLVLEPETGKLQRIDVIIGRDAADVDAQWRDREGTATTAVDGTVTLSGGGPAVGARVGVYRDLDRNGTVDPDDLILSYLDVAADGSYAGRIASDSDLIVRAEIKDVGRSAAAAAGTGVGLTVPSPVRLDYQIIDDATGETIPGRLLILGDHPAYPDQRVFETYDRLSGVVRSIHSVRGTSTGTVADPPLYLPAGGSYRVYASRGTEWSMTSAPFSATADGSLTLRLRHVIDTAGYLATEYHVHQVGSPDSPVGSLERVRSALSSGVELFAVTDHDVVSDLQPIVEDLAVDDQLRIIPGIEITPFAYGHFNAYPMTPEANATGGAVDWGRGREGYAMVPSEIFDAARGRGARVVEVNHPRGDGGLTTFQKFFDRANLLYDYDNRVMFGDFQHTPVPNSWLRLPEETLWTDRWNALEVWNGFSMEDTDGDGTREITSLDRVLRDWFNMLSMGFYVAPIGNSDTHSSVKDPLGMPRTMVRVTDDSPVAVASGTVVDQAMNTIEGLTSARDIVVTDGPMIHVTSGGMPAIGRQVAAAAGSVTLDITVTAPSWAEFDTVEVFANSTPDSPVRTGAVSLVPLQCWTSRNLAGLSSLDPCVLAPLAPQSMTVATRTVAGGGGFTYLEATLSITLDATDIVTRAGATGSDAWLVVRARGDRSIFPILTDGVVDGTTLSVLVNGNANEVDAVLRGRGVSASAFTAPIFLDFDGNGYRAPFQP